MISFIEKKREAGKEDDGYQRKQEGGRIEGLWVS